MDVIRFVVHTIRTRGEKISPTKQTLLFRARVHRSVVTFDIFRSLKADKTRNVTFYSSQDFSDVRLIKNTSYLRENSL